jgi:hypothetical protein
MRRPASDSARALVRVSGRRVRRHAALRTAGARRGLSRRARRQRIEARFGDRNIAFSAVLQSDAGVLSLLALTPYGSRAFLLQQRGKALAFTRYVDRDLPFPPRFIMLDVHRTLFLGLPGAPLPDGDHTAVQHGERIAERWRGGRLLERTFERVDGRPAGRIRIAYQGGMRPPLPPARMDLDNGWFGYQLAIHTLADE